MIDSLKILEKAYFIRRVEEKLIEIYPTDLIQSPLHLSIGQESLAVGVCSNLNINDQLFTTYRSHAYYLAKGGNLNAFMAELMGRKNGCCKGKGGSMHLADSSVNFMGTSAIVGSTLPHAVGAAYANLIHNKSNLVVCVIGDGAADTGIYHESLNFAALHNLPVVFVIEDNDLAVHSTKQERQSFDLEKHAKMYGFLTYSLDDTQNPEKVSKFMKDVYLQGKTRKKPAWVKLKTFRYKEHVGVLDDFEIGYRQKSDYLAWLAKDPLIYEKFKANIIMEIDFVIEQAIKFAKNSPFPDPVELYTDVIQ